MNVKRWLHVVAAIAGISCAALIVFFIFGRASSQNTVEGEAPGQTLTDCGTIPAVRAPASKNVDKAAGQLPDVIDASGASVTPSDPEQIRWFARIQAASGLCTNEVQVGKKLATITIAFPDGMPRANVVTYSMSAIEAAFSLPLVRTRTKVIVTDPDGGTRTIVVSKRAWSSFRRVSEAGAAPFTVGGLAGFARKSGYGKPDVRTNGW
jgi:hypothetical protein